MESHRQPLQSDDENKILESMLRKTLDALHWMLRFDAGENPAHDDLDHVEVLQLCTHELNQLASRYGEVARGRELVSKGDGTEDKKALVERLTHEGQRAADHAQQIFESFSSNPVHQLSGPADLDSALWAIHCAAEIKVAALELAKIRRAELEAATARERDLDLDE